MMSSLKFAPVLVLVVVALAVSGCGRRGALERPAGPVAEPAASTDPGAVNPEAPEKRFILDPLID